MSTRAIHARETEETLARCVAIAVYYHNCPKSAQRAKEVVEDIREIAERIVLSGLDDDEAKRLIITPLKGELSSRYGVETTRHLSEIFDRILQHQLAMVGHDQCIHHRNI